MHTTLSVGPLKIGNDLPLILIAGPCVMESKDHALMMAERLTEMSQKLGIGLIYKTSFDKANRTSIKGERGLGLEASLEVFHQIREQFQCPVITDVHNADQCQKVADVVDVLQIPAFLCRQTDLLQAAAATGKVINIKKGQFLAPWDMANVVAKMHAFGNSQVMLCERGASFGYNTLISDMRALPILAKTGCPVIFDATHSVQQPGGAGQSSSGQREFAPILARAAIAVGVAGVFLETHENPDKAPSDGPNMIHLHDMPQVLTELMALDKVAKAYPRFL
ncbi:3-deoxy-8-phosphooctulonate synthase [Candidatus Finniella inopinata]|uniref:2-dehydro-3-deoxyphosphooctonate aldolase n=1 Tax=Candidatus Finniella inopinata TaxID=1696036 RepID=A0A4Q7DIH5_9PROT|nr:3-deoxy-8-phosphooctulonate synthase [Candidatus Finniella inopinata]RZI46512.1 3-deoxy-8-phosphooctulonate synthase [Candidatus Finniella inopinata]